MKAASTALLNLLATRQFYSADLYYFQLANGTNLYYTGGDVDISWNGQTWKSGSTGNGSGPFFDRKDNKAKCHWKVGVDVDQLVFDCIPGGATIGTGNVPLLTALRFGMFDGAMLTLYRAFMPTYGNTAAGTVIMFAGRVAEVDFSRSLTTFTINSHLELLNQNIPTHVFQAQCTNSLFDHNCTLIRANFSANDTCASGSTASVINAPTLSHPSSYSYTLGKIVFTGGQNSGFQRSIKLWTPTGGSGGTISLINPLPYIPAIGDAFTVSAGCDKQQGTCINFQNIGNFRGFPNTPVPETAI